VPKPSGAQLKVSVGYDLPRGNPIDNWSELDFKIGKAPVKAAGKGVRAVLRSGNIVDLRDVEDAFSFAVDGFDRNRDLYVRVDDNKASSSEESEA
jgi:hypothetical protein